jgi:hypothetical protein
VGRHPFFFLSSVKALNWIQLFFEAKAKRPQYPALCFPGSYWLLLAMGLESLKELKSWSMGAGGKAWLVDPNGTKSINRPPGSFQLDSSHLLLRTNNNT